ncbi:type I 3-dehydroquinate dehydratase, partial [Methanothrix sp.]|uniref:type I 3-dehydroquinate dehydratase n=1 Tax=Methanothrix sp. TaxID=90426 RepID=UPI003C707B88
MWRDEPEMNRPQIVAVLGDGATEDIKLASKADMIELRLDLIRDPLPAARAIRQATGKPIIATNRLRAEGGRFLGSERERMEILAQASEYADFIDIELQAE